MTTFSVVSSLAVAGLVNLLQSRRLAHEGTLAAGGVMRAVARQALALAYQRACNRSCLLSSTRMRLLSCTLST